MIRTILVAGLLAAASVAGAGDDFKAARDAVQSLVPGIQIDKVRPAPFDGFVEMLLGAQLIYVSVDGKYLLDGRLIEVATRRDLSEAAKGEVRKTRLADVGSGDRIVFPATAEKKHTITIFTDIDCGYCRKLHQQMAEYNELGIEVDYLFFPRAGTGSHSFDKAVSVWCAPDRNQALTAAKAGEEPDPKQCPNPIEMHFELGRELGVTGTPALVAEDGTLIPGYVPPDSLLAQLERIAAEAE